MMRSVPALLPPRRRPGGLAALVGVAVALLLLGLAFARATAPVTPPIIVQAVAAAPAVQEAAATAALAKLRADPAVAEAERIDPAELARIAGASDRALPALIEVRPKARDDRGTIARIVARIPDVAVQPSAPTPTPTPAATPLHRVAELIVLLAAAGTVGLVALAAAMRGETRWTVVALLRELGAGDAAILRAVLQDVAVDVAAGSGGGLVAALLLLASAGLLGWTGAALALAWAAGIGLLALAGATALLLARLRRHP